MSRVNQSHGATEPQRRGRGYKGTRGQGEKEKNTCSPASPPSLSLSTCLLVLASLFLRLPVAITLIFSAAPAPKDMRNQPKYKPLAPSRFFSDGKSARQLVEGTAPYSPEGKATPPITDLSK